MSTEEKSAKLNIEVIIEQLLDQVHGDSWLSEQSVDQLTAYIIEEAYELVTAVSTKNSLFIKDELADVLYQVLLQAHHQAISLGEVIRHLEKKLKQRHAHVFNNIDGQAGQVKTQFRLNHPEQSWLEIKNQEKQQAPMQLLDHVADCLPGLQKALKMQRIAAKVGFDWPDVSGVVDKLYEEIDELVNAVKVGDQVLVHDEMADVLFSSVNVARVLNIDPEVALQQACCKFRQRFNYIENELKKVKLSLNEASLEKMDELWCEAKLTLKPDGQ
ncbi:nucleoside triphosphate pyrophosphohydrolase [Piscirickettsia salmonis]|uniref:nucleoside triphosphate pyrophosphohydrolase n=1 Tax=Piscirickettsia salmonis TaxID=1238 RepID=UPI000F07B22A|nr:nucleoside triphosphate pyrophosphohydrolase [Piscirickettsiaceae bacterium NZ-RLO2]